MAGAERTKKSSGRILSGAAAAAVARKGRGERRTQTRQEAPEAEATTRNKPARKKSNRVAETNRGAMVDAEMQPSTHSESQTADTHATTGTTGNDSPHASDSHLSTPTSGIQLGERARDSLNGAAGSSNVATAASDTVVHLSAADASLLVNALMQAKAAAQAEGGGAPPLATAKKAKIPKPKGSIGGGKKGYHIQKSMGLEDDKDTYNAIMDTVHKVAAEATINLNSKWAQVSAEKLGQVYARVRQRHPCMVNYENDWATAALLQQYLSNSRKPKVRRAAKDKGKARERPGPVSLDSAMDSDTSGRNGRTGSNGDEDDEDDDESDSGGV